jgi:drug/metabolite transporter (DMT)-like permease
LTLRKYLVLVAVMVFASCGDVCLSRGMRDFGAVTLSNWLQLFTVLGNPWVLGGIALLILFFCSYLSALSWADLSYVSPATALSYIIMALLAQFLLHENVTLSRWMGIGLVTIGVGFVASGPALTTHTPEPPGPAQASADSALDRHTVGSDA